MLKTPVDADFCNYATCAEIYTLFKSNRKKYDSIAREWTLEYATGLEDSHALPIVKDSEIVILGHIGNGAYGTVSKVKWIGKGGNKECALKTINVKNEVSGAIDKVLVENARREASLLQYVMRNEFLQVLKLIVELNMTMLFNCMVPLCSLKTLLNS